MADADQSNLTTLTVDLLSAYVANNTIQHGDLAELIKSTHAALKIIDSPEPPAPVEPEHKPAVGLRKSLGSRAHIISMIDGKPYQTLKRHLSKHGLTPQEYRERYSLPRDYPMVAPAYSESRRAIAERLGLGRKVTRTQQATPAVNRVLDGGAVAKPVSARAKKAASSKADTGTPRKARSVPAVAAIAAAPSKAAPTGRRGRKPAPKEKPSAGKAATAAKPAARPRSTKPVA